MESRWYTPVVVLLWVTTMTWLTMAKVLPQFHADEPPGLQSLLTQEEHEPEVGWDLSVNDKPVGSSNSKIERQVDGSLRICNVVRVQQVPLREMLPEALRTMVGPIDSLDMVVTSHIDVDALGGLLGLQSSLQFGTVEDVVRITGTVRDRQLTLTPVLINNVTLPEMKLPLNDRTMLADSFSPQSRMLGLHADQRWTMPVFSPLQPSNAIELIEARVVERGEPLVWNNRAWKVRMVEYRPAGAAKGADQPSGLVWVREDGLVLKQQIQIFSSKLVFFRKSPDRVEP